MAGMEEPRQDENGIWHAGDAAFATKEQAEAYLIKQSGQFISRRKDGLWVINGVEAHTFSTKADVEAYLGKAPTSRSNPWLRILALLFVVILGAWGVYQLTGKGRGVDGALAASGKADRNCSDTTMAYIMSRRFVERALVAPSTAKFPGGTSSEVSSRIVGECKFLVSAYVDAQNSFGAMIRTRYTIEMEYLPDSKNWRGTNLQM